MYLMCLVIKNCIVKPCLFLLTLIYHQYDKYKKLYEKTTKWKYNKLLSTVLILFLIPSLPIMGLKKNTLLISLLILITINTYIFTAKLLAMLLFGSLFIWSFHFVQYSTIFFINESILSSFAIS